MLSELSTTHLALCRSRGTEIELWSPQNTGCDIVKCEKSNRSSKEKSVITALCWVNDAFLSFGTNIGELRVWNVKQQELRGTLQTQLRAKHANSSQQIRAIAPIGKSARCVCLCAHAVYSLDVQHMTLSFLLRTPDRQEMEKLCCSEAGSQLAISTSQTVTLWEPTPEDGFVTLKQQQSFAGHTAAPSAMTFLKDGNLLTCDSRIPTLMLWNVMQGPEGNDSGAACRSAIAAESVVKDVQVFTNRILSVHVDGSANIWELVNSVELTPYMRIPNLTNITRATWIDEGKVFLVTIDKATPSFHFIDSCKRCDKDHELSNAIANMPGKEIRFIQQSTETLSSGIPKPNKYGLDLTQALVNTDSSSLHTTSITLLITHALRAADTTTLRKIVYDFDSSQIEDTVRSIASIHASVFLRECAMEFLRADVSPDAITRLLIWIRHILRYHGATIKKLPQMYSSLSPLRVVLGEYAQQISLVQSYTERLNMMCSMTKEISKRTQKSGRKSIAAKRFQILPEGRVAPC